MLKNILNLNGAQSLNKTEQKAINGGGPITVGGGQTCPPGAYIALVLCESVCGTLGQCIADNDIPNCYTCNYDHK